MKLLRKNSNVLITGVTGLIGGEIFRRMLTRVEGHLWPLVRPTSDRTIGERLVNRLHRSGHNGFCPANVNPVAGDIQKPNWGLNASDSEEITSDVDFIIHNAADTSFVSHRDTARTNIGSVQHLIAFARRCRRTPMIVYMSSAANVGNVTGACLTEDEGCRPGNDHHNDYTHSKAVGESLVRESGLPHLILRPTIVLSAGIEDPVFARQILWCAPLFRAFEALPLDENSRMDIVDVDYVAECAIQLLGVPRKQHCYHLSAGNDRSVTLSELNQIVAGHYRRRRPLKMIPPGEWTRTLRQRYVTTPIQRRLYRSLRHYFPFLNMNVTYDNGRLMNELPVCASKMQPVADYFADLLCQIKQKAAMKEAALP